MELLSFDKRYAIAFPERISTASATLVDDPDAQITFTLTEPQTVLAIYKANSAFNDPMPFLGFQLAINVDGVDYANTWDSPYSASYPARNMTFWVGYLGAGTHTIKGRFASNYSGSVASIRDRFIQVLTFYGDAFFYLDWEAVATTSSVTFIDDPYASISFDLYTFCKALIMYNASNRPGDTESYFGKKTAINVNGVDYNQAEKSAGGTNYPDSIFTAHALRLSPGTYTIKGRFANAGTTATVSVRRRQLAVLLLEDRYLLSIASSTARVSTTSSTLVDDPYAILNVRTKEPCSMLAIAVATKRHGVTSNIYGECYGINVNGFDETLSRGSPYSSSHANSVASALVRGMGIGDHVIKGRFSNNYVTTTAVISARHLITIWFTSYAYSIISKRASDSASGTDDSATIRPPKIEYIPLPQIYPFALIEPEHHNLQIDALEKIQKSLKEMF